jgi:hypothetical protein
MNWLWPPTSIVSNPYTQTSKQLAASRDCCGFVANKASAAPPQVEFATPAPIHMDFLCRSLHIGRFERKRRDPAASGTV